MSATSRKTARKALGALLKTALEGTGKLAQAVYDYTPAELKGSPIIYVRTATLGATRAKRVGQGQTKSFNTFGFEIMICTIAPNADTGWDAATVADAEDDLEAGVRDVVQVNPTNAAWMHIQFTEDGSQMAFLQGKQTGGIPYDVEIVPVEVRVNDT